MAKQYQVVGACVTDIPTGGPMGPTRITLYKDAFLPSDVPDDRIEHLLSVKLIKEVGGPDKPVEQTSSPQPSGDGKGVNARSSKAELVDYGVAQGGTRAELEDLNLKELQARYLKGAQQ
ncbi:hypothetical protein [Streptosporangium sp. V21-05]|uniref:hypothetical protein n=1 Tax=Streptosporangium sp. V21-05 TaxID=3446115 RepID=UPI003F52AD30